MKQESWVNFWESFSIPTSWTGGCPQKGGEQWHFRRLENRPMILKQDDQLCARPLLITHGVKLAIAPASVKGSLFLTIWAKWKQAGVCEATFSKIHHSIGVFPLKIQAQTRSLALMHGDKQDTRVGVLQSENTEGANRKIRQIAAQCWSSNRLAMDTHRVSWSKHLWGLWCRISHLTQPKVALRVAESSS